MTFVRDRDFGTPLRPGANTVTLRIDGRSVTVAGGTSVMAAAMQAGMSIPKLCATDMVEAFGSCRLCLVEIDGRRGTPASCTTPAEDGMVVHTQTDRLAKLRKGVMELYISDHPLDCLTCSANGDCELQDVAGAVGLRDVRYGYDGDKHRQEPKDESNPYFTFDSSKCIVCSRCVRACEEVQGTFALTIEGRGLDSKVSPGGVDFLGSECVSCGACVQACPTATLNEKSVIQMGTPTRSVVTTCAYCGVGCSFRAEMQGDRVVRMVPSKDGKANEGHSCVKGRFAWGYATHSDRIRKPMIRARISDPWREVTWEEAFAHAASEFRRIQAQYGRDSIGGITSSRCTNEEVFVLQKLIRAGFGNNNVDTCARVCHSPTGYGLKQTFGTSAGTQDFRSVEKADVVLLIGANPTDGHPVFASRLKKRLRQGAQLIVADPRRIDLVKSPHVAAAHHLQLLPGTNVALVNALAHVVVTEGLVKEDYVRERCDLEAFEHWARFIAQDRRRPAGKISPPGGEPIGDIRRAPVNRLFDREQRKIGRPQRRAIRRQSGRGIALVDPAERRTSRRDQQAGRGRIAPHPGESRRDGSPSAILEQAGNRDGLARRSAWPDCTDIVGQPAQDERGGLCTIELLDDEAADERFKLALRRIARDLHRHREIGDRPGIEAGIAAMRAHDRRSHVGGTGIARQAGKMESSVATAIAVAAFAGQFGARCLSADQQRGPKGGTAYLEAFAY